MNDLSHQIGLMQREFRDVHGIMSRFDASLAVARRASSPPPQALLAKVLTCHVLGRKGGGAARAVAEVYGNDAGVLRALARPGLIGKSATAPAMTTVSGWAAELASPGNLATLQILAPNSVYRQLSQRPGAIRVDLSGRGSVRVPTRAPAPLLAAPFVGEGQAIAVRQMAVAVAALAPKKCAVISQFTEEMLKASAPSIEKLVRATMEFDTASAIDGVLLGSTAATTIAPAGLLAGVTPTTATPAGYRVCRRRPRARRGYRGQRRAARPGARDVEHIGPDAGDADAERHAADYRLAERAGQKIDYARCR
jgi:hypothetical protein